MMQRAGHHTRAAACLALAATVAACAGCRAGCEGLPPVDSVRSKASIEAAHDGHKAHEPDQGGSPTDGPHIVTLSHAWECDDCFWLVFVTDAEPEIAKDLSRGMMNVDIQYRFEETGRWEYFERDTAVRSSPDLISSLLGQTGPSLPGLQVRPGGGPVTEVLFDGVRPRGAGSVERVSIKFPNDTHYGRYPFDFIVPESVPILRCEECVAAK